jgi:phosphoglycolate phosphatase
MSDQSGREVRAVIFDLDGTLVQTRTASWEIFEKISKQFDLGVDRPEQYFDLFRGNVFESIRKLCRDDAHAARAKKAFLELLRSDYTPPLVPGVTDVVRRLAGDCTLAVMSSNAMAVLRRVLVANDLAFCFAHVFGGDVAPDKRAAIGAFLADSGSGYGRRCEADYDEGGRGRDPDPGSTVLVTDTAGDVRDALEAGIRVVGVAWGMHSVEELTAAGAEFVALWPQEIAAHLLGDAAARSPGGACAIRRGPIPDAAPDAAPGPAGRCGCGCTADPEAVDTSGMVQAAARVRRGRRRAAAATWLDASLDASPPRRSDDRPEIPAGDTAVAELLVAIRRVCADA